MEIAGFVPKCRFARYWCTHAAQRRVRELRHLRIHALPIELHAELNLPRIGARRAMMPNAAEPSCREYRDREQAANNEKFQGKARGVPGTPHKV